MGVTPHQGSCPAAVPRVRCPRGRGSVPGAGTVSPGLGQFPGAGTGAGQPPPVPSKPIPKGAPLQPEPIPASATSQPGTAGVTHRNPSPWVPGGRAPPPCPRADVTRPPRVPGAAAGWSPELACASPSASPSSSRSGVSSGARGARIPLGMRGVAPGPGAASLAHGQSRGWGLGRVLPCSPVPPAAGGSRGRVWGSLGRSPAAAWPLQAPALGLPRLPGGAGQVSLQTAPRPLRQLLQRPAPRGGHGPGAQRHPAGHLVPDHRHGEPGLGTGTAPLPAASPAQPLKPARITPKPAQLPSSQLRPLCRQRGSPPKAARPPRIQLSPAGHSERPPGWGPRGGRGHRGPSPHAHPLPSAGREEPGPHLLPVGPPNLAGRPPHLGQGRVRRHRQHPHPQQLRLAARHHPLQQVGCAEPPQLLPEPGGPAGAGGLHGLLGWEQEGPGVGDAGRWGAGGGLTAARRAWD